MTVQTEPTSGAAASGKETGAEAEQSGGGEATLTGKDKTASGKETAAAGAETASPTVKDKDKEGDQEGEWPGDGNTLVGSDKETKPEATGEGRAQADDTIGARFVRRTITPAPEPTTWVLRT